MDQCLRTMPVGGWRDGGVVKLWCTYLFFMQKTHAQFPSHPWWLTTYLIPVPGDLTSGLQGTAFMWYTSIHAHKKLTCKVIKLN